MKLLYIVPYVPYPLNSGGNQAYFTLTDCVRKKHELSILLYAHNKEDLDNINALKILWKEVRFYVYDENQKEKKSREDAEGLFANMTWQDRTSCRFFLSVAQSMRRKILRRQIRYVSKQKCSTTEDLVRTRSTLFATNEDLNADFCKYVQKISAIGFDVIQIEFYEYLPLVYLLPPETKKVFVHHEIRFVRNENELQLFKQIKPTDLITFQREKAFEISCLSAYDAVITLTETDRKILGKLIMPSKLFASPAVVATTLSRQLPFKPATELVFIGGGDHFPNADAMMWFCGEIIPVLKKTMTKMPRLNIVGQWRDEQKASIQALFPEASFTGYIDDLYAFINGKISIVPIRIGSGMRIKILDSVFALAPIVTTTKGCEGIPMVNRENCLIADEPKSFANAIMEMLYNVGLQKKLSTNALSTKNWMLNKEKLIEKRLSVYKSLVGSSNL